MEGIEARAEAMCVAPAGCAFLLHAEAAGLAPDVAARPEVAIHLAAAALATTNWWSGDHDEIVARALAEGPRLGGLAREVLARPEAIWWFAPVDRSAQLSVPWIAPKGDRPDPAHLTIPTGEPHPWERYAQKPEGGLFTSTAVGGASSALAAFSHGVGDHDPEPPLVRYRLRAAPDARIFEVDGPAAWRRLCLRYPTVDDDGRTVPNWAAVAREWDGVHMTLGGLLTSDQVRIEGPEGWTQHRFWEAELTVWLRWVFTDIARLPDLADGPELPVALPQPPALVLRDETPWRKHVRFQPGKGSL